MPSIPLDSYPHIADSIIASAAGETLLSLRLVSHFVKERVDAHLGQHVVISRRGFLTTTSGVFNPGMSLSCPARGPEIVPSRPRVVDILYPLDKDELASVGGILSTTPTLRLKPFYETHLHPNWHEYVRPQQAVIIPKAALLEPEDPLLVRERPETTARKVTVTSERFWADGPLRPLSQLFYLPRAPVVLLLVPGYIPSGLPDPGHRMRFVGDTLAMLATVLLERAESVCFVGTHEALLASYPSCVMSSPGEFYALVRMCIAELVAEKGCPDLVARIRLLSLKEYRELVGEEVYRLESSV